MRINGNKQGDTIIDLARQDNQQIMMSIFGFYPPYTSREGLKNKQNQQVLQQYLDYVIARYAAQIDIWELTNEALPPLEWLNFISDYLHKNDPYQHPITTSLEEPRLNNSDLLSIHYYPETPINNRKLVEQIEKFHQDFAAFPHAKIISEFGFAYENHFPNSADWLRKYTWLFAFHQTGVIFWNTGYGYYAHPNNGNIYLGPEERKYLQNLRNFLPPMSLPIRQSHWLDAGSSLAVYELKNNKHHLLYVLSLDENRTQPQSIKVELTKSSKIIFFKPKSGKIISETAVEAGQKQLALPSFRDDLAVRIEYK